MGRHRSPIGRRGGFAMVLVMLAVAVAMVLSFAYLASQGVSVQLTRNIDARTKARMIAESGLSMAIAYVRRDEAWRSAQSQGVWVQDHPFAGGTFTILGQDGQDVDGDGLVDGDGDLADDRMDMLTLTAVGSFDGARHRVRAVVPPTKWALMVVGDPGAMTIEDTARYSLLRNWGWEVRLLRAKATAAEFDEAAQDVNVVYFPAHTALETVVKDKLKALALPIVMGQKKLVGELRIAANESKDYLASSIRIRELTRTITDSLGVETTQVVKHYITEKFPVGDLTIASAATRLLRLDGGTIGTQSLADKADEPGRIALGVLECGALQADKRPARARRVALPWGKEDLSFSILSLNDSGQTILKRSLDWTGSSWRGLITGIAVWDAIEVKDMSRVDGFDAMLGPYGGANVNQAATLSTNSCESAKILVDGGTVLGSLYVSPSADFSQVVKVDHGGAVTGGSYRLSLNVPIPTLYEPSGMVGSSGDRTFVTGVTVIDSDRHYSKLRLTGDAEVRISGDVRILCDDDVRIEMFAKLVLETGATLAIYTKKAVEVRGAARVNVDAGDPTRLNWLVLKDEVTLNEGARLCAAMQAYDGELNVKGGAQFYGTFVGKKVKLENSALFHVDTGSSGTVITLGGGVDLEKITAMGIRWVERP